MSALPPSPVEPVAFIERGGRLLLRLGGRAVEGGRLSPHLETELLGGLETVLRTRNWRGARSAVALDDRGRRLDIRQAEGHLVLSALDPGERCIVEPVSVPMVDFARAITAFVHRPRRGAPGGPDAPHARRTASALLGWAEAVARGDCHGPTAPPDWSEAPAPVTSKVGRCRSRACSTSPIAAPGDAPPTDSDTPGERPTASRSSTAAA